MSEVRTTEKQEPKTKENKASNTKTLKELRLELQKLVLDVRSGKEKNTSLIRRTKKEIARLLTKLKINNGK